MKPFEKAKWITLPEFSGISPIHPFHRQLEKIDLPKPLTPDLHILFRVRFVPEGNEPVLLRFTADDYAKIWLNGVFLTQGPAPGFPDRYYYAETDLTPLLRPGENVLAFHTYYQGLINRVWVSGDGRLGLLFEVVQGSRVLAQSREGLPAALHTGFSSAGIIGYETQFAERYDSRAPETGFEQIGYDDSRWKKSAVCRYADYALLPQPTKQLDFETVNPVVLRRDPDGWFADFGAQYVGTLAASVRGRAGCELRLIEGQELNPDGSIRFELRSNCRYEDYWTLSGGTDCLDRYDYSSFRYAKIFCSDETELLGLALNARHYPFTLKAECRETDPRLRAVWELCVRSLNWGAQEVLQDCMDREKGQYMGDGTLTASAFSVLTGDTALMEKLIDDALGTAFITPTLMTCSPCSFMQEIADYCLLFPFLFLVHYRLKGDRGFLRHRYSALARLLDGFKNSYARDDGLLQDLDKWCLVDWPDTARDGYDFDLTEGQVARGCHNVINAYWLASIGWVNRIAEIIGLPPYLDRKCLEEAFLRAFYDPERHLFTDTETTTHAALASNALPLWFGLTPDREAEENARRMILTKEADKSAFFVTFASLCALTRLGDRDGIRQLLLDEGRWLRMIREGATNTFEAWGKDLKWNTSLNHLCYSYACLFLTDWGLEDLVKA